MEEEEKVETKGARNKIPRNRTTKSIVNPRTESRQTFLDIPLTDPRMRLQNIQIDKAKIRRHQNFMNNRIQRKEKRLKTQTEDHEGENLIKQVKEVKNIKQLADIVLALTKSVNALIRNFQQEIENIKKLIDIKIEEMDKDKGRIKELEARIEEKIQYIENFKEAG